MSTTAYQTSAKPRGRRGSHEETSNKPSRSRASSSVSTKLSKTLSRTFDEIAVPRHSRPTSPAVFPSRPRTHDHKASDSAVMPSRYTPASLTSDKSVQPRPEEAVSLTPGSPTKSRPHSFQEYHDDVRSFEVLEHHPRPVSPPKSTEHPIEAIRSDMSGPDVDSAHHMKSSYSLGRKSLSSKSLVSMQPTVAEEADEPPPEEPPSTFSEPGTSTPAPRYEVSVSDGIPKPDCPEEAFATSLESSKASLDDSAPVPLARMSTSSLPENVITASPRTSKSSLRDTSFTHLPRTSGSSLHEPLPAPTPQGHVTFMQPSLDQRLADSAGRGLPVSSSHMPAAEVAVFPDFMPQSQSPFGSPPMSPFMHQQMRSPPPQSLQNAQSYSYAYPPPFMPSPNLPPAFYPAPFPYNHAPFAYQDDLQRASSAGPENEKTRLLEKVSNALPDLSRLLHYYQESQGLLSEKDNFVRVAENQHKEETARLRVELSACKEAYEKIIGQQASENLKLKDEIAEHAERTSFLEDSSHELVQLEEETVSSGVRQSSMAEEILVSRSLNEKMVTDKKQLEDEVTVLRSQLQDQINVHEYLRADLNQAHQSEMAAREEEHIKSQHEHKTDLSKVQLDLAALITKYAQVRKDLDSARIKISQHEQTLIDKAREFEDTIQSHILEVTNLSRLGEEEAARHNDEIGNLSQEHANRVAKHKEAQKLAELQFAEATRQYQEREAKHLAEVETRQAEVDNLRHELEDERTARSALKTEYAMVQQAHDTLRTGQEKTDKHHMELTEIVISLKNKQAEWQQESNRMDQVLQNLKQLKLSKRQSDDFV